MNLLSPCRALMLILLPGAASCLAGGSVVSFLTPEIATNALLTAIENDAYPLFLSIAGRQMAEFWGTGDPEKDEIERHRFADAARRCGFGFKAKSGTDEKSIVSVCEHAQLFPAPLVRTKSGWHFDDEAGARELAMRRIHRDEVAAVDLCRRFRDAELSFFDLETGAVPAFAQKIRSTPGTHDGLVWSGLGREDESPLGPAFAAAAFAEQQPPEGPKPLFGYYFKILAAPVPNSESRGVRDRQPSEGVALIAWPAHYGIGGFRTFVINHLGGLYQKDFGLDTARIVKGISSFVPDRSWSRVDGE